MEHGYDAAAARESARRKNGQFGPQAHDEQTKGLSALEEDSADEATEVNVSPADRFEQAMKRNAAYDRIEARLEYKRKKLAELKGELAATTRVVPHTFSAMQPGTISEYNDDYARFEKVLTEAEKDTIRKYTALSYLPLNKYLTDPERWKSDFHPIEGGSTLDERRRYLDDMATVLDSALAKAPRRHRTLLRRIDQDLTREFTDSRQWATANRFVTGSTVTFNGFSSTTIDPEYIGRTVYEDEELTSVILVLQTDKGAPVDYALDDVRDANYTQDREREILLPRGLAFKVNSVAFAEYEGGGGGTTRTVLTAFLTEVGNDTSPDVSG